MIYALLLSAVVLVAAGLRLRQLEKKIRRLRDMLASCVVLKDESTARAFENDLCTLYDVVDPDAPFTGFDKIPGAAISKIEWLRTQKKGS